MVIGNQYIDWITAEKYRNDLGLWSCIDAAIILNTLHPHPPPAPRPFKPPIKLVHQIGVEM